MPSRIMTLMLKHRDKYYSAPKATPKATPTPNIDVINEAPPINKGDEAYDESRSGTRPNSSSDSSDSSLANYKARRKETAG